MRQQLGTYIIDVATKNEIQEAMSLSLDTAIRQMDRGIDYMRQPGYNNSSSVTINGPESGFTWEVKHVGVVISAAATISIWHGENQSFPQDTQTVAAAGPVIFKFSSQQFIVFPSQTFMITASTGNITSYIASGTQVPAEMFAKLLG